MQKSERNLQDSGASETAANRNGVDILADYQWHMADAESGTTIHLDNYDPILLRVYSPVDAPFNAREEIAENEATFPVDFIRNQGSWGREGQALSCSGVAKIDGKKIPTRLLVWERAGGTGIFLHALNPQPNTRI